jgi:hypothetical protein
MRSHDLKRKLSLRFSWCGTSMAVLAGSAPAWSDTIPAPIISQPGPDQTTSFYQSAKPGEFTDTFLWTSVASAWKFLVKFGPDSLLPDSSSRIVEMPAKPLEYMRSARYTDSAFESVPILRYFWKVAAVDSSGNSSWSDARPVRIADLPPTINLGSGDSGVPAAWSVFVHDVTTNKYFYAYDASKPPKWGYRIQVSSDSAFKSLTHDTSVGVFGSPSVVLRLKPGSLHFCRVREFETYWIPNLWITQPRSVWSKPFSFMTAAAPVQAPALVHPDNRSQVSSNDDETGTHFSWEAQRGAAEYTFRLAEDSSFTKGLVERAGLVYLDWKADSTNRAGLSLPLLPGRAYYWSVKSRYPGGETAWSPMWSLTTDSLPPAKTTLVYPTKDEKVLPRNLPLDWLPVPGATRYAVRVMDSPSGSILLEDTVPVPGRILSGLIPGKSYSWQVTPLAGSMSGQPSTIWTFVVVPVQVDSSVTSMIPVRKGMSWTYSHYYQDYSEFGQPPKVPVNSRDSGLMSIRILESQVSRDSVLMRVEIKEYGVHAEWNQPWENYSRSSTLIFLQVNSRLLVRPWDSLIWRDSDSPYFSLRRLLEAKSKEVWVNGSTSTQMSSSFPFYPFNWSSGHLEYYRDFGLYSLNGYYHSSSALAGQLTKIDRQHLIEFNGVRVDSLFFQETPPTHAQSLKRHFPKGHLTLRDLPEYLGTVKGLRSASLFDLGGRLVLGGRVPPAFSGPEPVERGLHILLVHTNEGKFTRLIAP